jgi:ribosomal protein S18 acetylase RimI-like enzyme
MTYRTRPAATTDLPALEEIAEAAYGPWVAVIGGRPAPMDTDYAALIDSGRIHVTMPPAGGERAHVAGLIVLVPEDGALLVENVAVHPRFQGRGIGRALMAFADAEARRRRLPALRLFTHETMTANIALYGSLGYVETHRQPIGHGRLVFMRKHLDAPLSDVTVDQEA